MKVFGQELNALTASIARMNLFLHGVQEYTVVNGDTLTEPAFIQNGHLQQFDIVLANPPYSIKQWNRDAFATDKWGRNFLGVPPQGRADYAFFQHILASMNQKGRCAILFPNGILSRLEEKEMREKLIMSDKLDCIIGVGKNLFYNSAMEACIVICNNNKPSIKQGKILFIDGRKQITRKNSESFLTPEHISLLTSVYHSFESIDGISSVRTIREIEENGYSLAVPLYVNTSFSEGSTSLDASSVSDWNSCLESIHSSIDALSKLIEP